MAPSFGQTRNEIRDAVLLHGMSHRAAAAMFGVSLRQVQKSVNPLKRTMQDRSYYRRNREYYLKYQREYWRRKQKEKEKGLSLPSPSS